MHGRSFIVKDVLLESYITVQEDKFPISIPWCELHEVLDGTVTDHEYSCPQADFGRHLTLQVPKFMPMHLNVIPLIGSINTRWCESARCIIMFINHAEVVLLSLPLHELVVQVVCSMQGVASWGFHLVCRPIDEMRARTLQPRIFAIVHYIFHWMGAVVLSTEQWHMGWGPVICGPFLTLRASVISVTNALTHLTLLSAPFNTSAGYTWCSWFQSPTFRVTCYCVAMVLHRHWASKKSFKKMC